MSTIAKNKAHVWSGAAETISGKNIKPTDNVSWFQKNTERLPPNWVRDASSESRWNNKLSLHQCQNEVAIKS